MVVLAIRYRADWILRDPHVFQRFITDLAIGPNDGVANPKNALGYAVRITYRLIGWERNDSQLQGP